MCWEVAKCAFGGHQYVVLDVPLLYEANIMIPWFHKVRKRSIKIIYFSSRFLSYTII